MHSQCKIFGYVTERASKPVQSFRPHFGQREEVRTVVLSALTKRYFRYAERMSQRMLENVQEGRVYKPMGSPYSFRFSPKMSLNLFASGFPEAGLHIPVSAHISFTAEWSQIFAWAQLLAFSRALPKRVRFGNAAVMCQRRFSTRPNQQTIVTRVIEELREHCPCVW